MSDLPNSSNQTAQPVHQKETGLIAFFANNPVAANLMMVFIIVMGLVSYNTIQRQMFPNIEINWINIQATYPGAAPREIEESILIKIEEAIKDITEVKQSISRSFRNGGRISLRIREGEDINVVLDKIRTRVDSIGTFPADMEPIQVTQAEFQQDVIEMSLVGDYPLEKLKPVALQIENELLQLQNVSLASVSAPQDEIAIEVLPDTLRQYNLTINDVLNAVRRYSANFSAGQVRTEGGTIAVRVEEQMYNGEEFRNIPVVIGSNGGRVLLKEVATIKDGFTEGERYFSYSGDNAIFMSVKATKTQDTIPVAESVKAYIEKKNQELPSSMQIKILVDMTYYLNARLDMMLGNLLQGGFWLH